MSRRIIVRGPGLRGPAGRDGLPGVNAIPADEAVAAYVADEGSATYEALQNAGLGNADILLSDTRPVSPTVGLVRIGLPVEPDPEPGTVILGDNFDRTDADVVGSPQVGSAPTEQNAWIRSNALRLTGPSAKISWSLDEDDVTIEFNIGTPGVETGVIEAVHWRFTDNDNCYRLTGGEGLVQKFVGGVYTPMGSIGQGLVLGNVVRITSNGSTHTIEVDGTQVYTHDDAGLASGGVQFAGNNGQPSVDYLTVTTP